MSNQESTPALDRRRDHPSLHVALWVLQIRLAAALMTGAVGLILPALTRIRPG